MKKKVLFLLFLSAAAAALIFGIHNVPLRPTSSEIEFYNAVLEPLDLPENLNSAPFEVQIKAVNDIQHLAFAKIHHGFGIPLNKSREPESAVEFGEGECYDRTRFLEKAFRHLGFKARHISIYSNEEQNRFLPVMLSTNTHSHATTEVRTSRGWLIVDSNDEWVSLSNNNQPVGIKEIDARSDLLEPISTLSSDIYLEKDIVVYGLYSRHGRFFRPFNSIPDVNWRELLFNL